MSIRQTAKVRGGAAAAVVAALAVALAGCGVGDDAKSPNDPKDSQAASQTKGTPQPLAPSAGDKNSDPTVVLATVNGASGMTMVINSVQRDAGGFLTVNGQIKNAGSEVFAGTSAWRGIELKGSGESVAGATLVDKAGKKRYYVLRDTESRCLCTTGISSVAAGQTVPFFAQFPAPPASTTEVEFSLPTFASATVKISG
ncbi:hypothetical protein [Streptomyces sp. RerS4]|uniref:hypothetical protein n=1 Tax=Streptomyces sp. RerS4 TaxID=2942449 RepID=UPI00201C5A44|nr:hypothetical protein [Streptomyces sp. RerS4]UQX02744.1 hypothetical protein M4D82_21315 [Streptomyces sp. RerS4]